MEKARMFVKKKKHIIEYPNLPSATRSLPHSDLQMILKRPHIEEEEITLHHQISSMSQYEEYLKMISLTRS